jgi:transposase
MAKKQRVRAGRPRVVSDEVRKRLFFKYFDEGYSADDIFRHNSDVISRATAFRLVADFRETHDWRSFVRRQRVRVNSARTFILSSLSKCIENRPAAFLDELQRELRNTYKIRISVSQICRYVHEPAPRGLGYSLQVLERRAIQKDYAERLRYLNTMASGMFPTSQLICNNQAVLRALHEGVQTLPACKMAGFFRKCGYKVESEGREEDEGVVVAVAAATVVVVKLRGSTHF